MVRRQGWLVYVSFLFEQHIASPCVREYILRIPWHPGMFKMFLVRYPTTTNVVSCFPWIFTEAGHSSNTFPPPPPAMVILFGSGSKEMVLYHFPTSTWMPYKMHY